MKSVSPLVIAAGGSLLTVGLCCMLIPAVAPVTPVQCLAAGVVVVPLFAGLGWAANVTPRTRRLEEQRRRCCRWGRAIGAVWLVALGVVIACQVHRIPGLLHGIAGVVVFAGGLAACILAIRREHLEDEIRRRGWDG